MAGEHLAAPMFFLNFPGELKEVVSCCRGVSFSLCAALPDSAMACGFYRGCQARDDPERNSEEKVVVVAGATKDRSTLLTIGHFCQA